MGEGRRRHGRWFDLVATVLIGLVVTGAALVPAVTANSGGTTTIRGDVSVDGQRLAFFPVGFWVPGDGVLSSTTTDANGIFTLDVPSIRDGFAYAGTEPDAERAVLDADGRHVVRGTIGAKAARPISSPLYQGWEAAVGHSLAGGAAQLHFRLQEAGRVGGTLPVAANRVRAVQVRRLDGSIVAQPKADSRGRWLSPLLTPGRYAVAIVPVAPLLPVAAQVDVQADRTVRASLPAPRTGATVSGTLRSAAGVSVGGVPVLLQQDGDVVASTATSSTGAYSFAGLAGGDYTVVAGRYAASSSGSDAPVEVPIPGRSTSTTSSPSATLIETPSPSPTEQVLEPVQRTVEAVQPVQSDVIVPDATGSVIVDLEAAPAGRIDGTVSGAEGERVQVAVEDVASGLIVGTADAGADGRWRVGGLQPGAAYTVWAVSRPADATSARMGTADAVAVAPGGAAAGTATGTGADGTASIVLDQAAAQLQGTVQGATAGSVMVGDTALLQRTGEVDASGAYVVQGLVPGLYPVVVRTPKRLVSDPVAERVQGDGGSVSLQPGPAAAQYRGWFISGGDGVSIVSGTASTPGGAVARIGPEVADGWVSTGGLRPGTYTYDADSFSATVPALDGPWWFDAPQGSFTLNDGQTTNVGPVVLHVKAR